MSNNLTYLSKHEYVRPTVTTQDKITEEDIEEMLEDYEEVQDIHTIAKNTHIRYFTVIQEKDQARKVFRIGGTLVYASPDNTYVILSNGERKWSVQNANSIYYRQLTVCEIKEEYEDILDDYEEEIKELKMINRKLYKKLTGQDNKMKTNMPKVKKYHEDKSDLRVKKGGSENRNTISESTTKYNIILNPLAKVDDLHDESLYQSPKTYASGKRPMSTKSKSKKIPLSKSDMKKLRDKRYKEADESNMTESYIGKNRIRL